MNCSECMFWVKKQDDENHGECRRYPPIPFLQTLINPITQSSGMVVTSVFPSTKGGLWCAELVPAKTEGKA
jgi:hypothetical protein